jgi:hypothetical protein
VLHLFGDNRETIRQHFTPDMSYIVNHEKSPSRPAENGAILIVTQHEGMRLR